MSALSPAITNSSTPSLKPSTKSLINKICLGTSCCSASKFFLPIPTSARNIYVSAYFLRNPACQGHILKCELRLFLKTSRRISGDQTPNYSQQLCGGESEGESHWKYLHNVTKVRISRGRKNYSISLWKQSRSGRRDYLLCPNQASLEPTRN